MFVIGSIKVRDRLILMKQLLVRWDKHWEGVETTGDMSQLSERCDGHRRCENSRRV